MSTQPDGGEAVKRYTRHETSGAVLHWKDGVAYFAPDGPYVLASDYDAQALKLREVEREHHLAALQLSAYSLNPDRITQTEIAMARVANTRAADAIEKLRAAESELSRIKQALEWAQDKCIAISWKWNSLRADAILECEARDRRHETATGPTIVAAIEALQAKCEEKPV